MTVKARAPRTSACYTEAMVDQVKLVALLGVWMGGLGAVGCEDPYPTPEPVDTGPCVVDDDTTSEVSQGLAALPTPPGFEIVLDESSGGPLRCRPTLEPCEALSACQGAAVDVEVGVDVTLTVGLRTVGETGLGPAFTITLGDHPDGVFQVLEPSFVSGSTIDGGTAFAFVAVNAPAAGTYSVDVNVLAQQAANAPQDGSPVVVSLTVNAVEP